MYPASNKVERWGMHQSELLLLLQWDALWPPEMVQLTTVSLVRHSPTLNPRPSDDLRKAPPVLGRHQPCQSTLTLLTWMSCRMYRTNQKTLNQHVRSCHWCNVCWQRDVCSLSNSSEPVNHSKSRLVPSNIRKYHIHYWLKWGTHDVILALQRLIRVARQTAKSICQLWCAQANFQQEQSIMQVQGFQSSNEALKTLKNTS